MPCCTASALRIAFVAGFAVLGAGSLVCAVAPNMEILLVGRLFQGLAGGLLCGLSFAVINTVLPRRLWSRGSALAASTWGIGALVGPALGGFFAQFGAWRWAFGLLAMLSVGMAVLAPGLLTTDGAEPPPTAMRPGFRFRRSFCWARPR